MVSRSGRNGKAAGAKGLMQISLVLITLAMALPLAGVAPAHADAGFRKWLSDFYQVAAKSGVTRQTYEAVFRGIREPDPVVLKALNRVRTRQLNAEKARAAQKADALAKQRQQSATPWPLGLEDVGLKGVETARKTSMQRPVSRSRTRPVSRLRAPIEPAAPSQPRPDRALSHKSFTNIVDGLTDRAEALEAEIKSNDALDSGYLIAKAQECIEWGRTFFDTDHLSGNEDVQMIIETLDEMDEVLILMSIEADTDKTDVAKLLKQAAREVEFYLGA